MIIDNGRVIIEDMVDYQDATRETAIYPEAGTGSILALAYVGLGLGEAGEIQGKIKKILRDSNGQVSKKAKEAILAEAGDLVWYLARLFDELETTFEDVAQANVDKLFDRKDRGVLGGSGDNR